MSVESGRVKMAEPIVGLDNSAKFSVTGDVKTLHTKNLIINHLKSELSLKTLNKIKLGLVNLGRGQNLITLNRLIILSMISLSRTHSNIFDSCYHLVNVISTFSDFQSTVKPVSNGHPWGLKKVAVV